MAGFLALEFAAAAGVLAGLEFHLAAVVVVVAAVDEPSSGFAVVIATENLCNCENV